jgi:2-polyprenyl-3-methyl-5-hydroxy-6-metoxy-1,4-benzoquinol methylase
MKESVIDYYSESYNEASRHRVDAFGVIQEIRTKELLVNYLGMGKKSILDVGGATGVYSFYLADLGHDVSLLDIVPKHINYVKEENNKTKNKLKNIYLGDARSLEINDKYDLIIVHGPLYHITDRDERISVLSRMKDLLNDNGKILGFAINRYAGYFYGVRSGNILDDDYKNVVLNEINTGFRYIEPGWYFHRPSELISEFIDAGLKVIDTKSVTSQIWMLPDIEKKIPNPKFLKEIIDLAQRTENEIEIGQDILCVGKR